MDRWTDNRRGDGTQVIQGLDGWIIMPADEGSPVSLCPCCDKPFLTDRAARLVADRVFPCRVSRPDADPDTARTGTAGPTPA